MKIIEDYKKLGFSKDLLYLYSGKLFLDFGVNVFSLFLPIFLYQHYQDINIVILYYLLGSLLYFILLPLGAKLMGEINMKNSIIISVFFRLIFFLSFYKFLDNPNLYFIISLLAITMMRNTFWLPFHTEAALLTNKKNRGKQFGIILSITAILGTLAPIIAGFVLEKWSFSVLAIISLLLSLLSLLFFNRLPDNKEEYSWTFKETFKYFFHPYNRRMVIAYMSDGVIGIIRVLFWPLFIFMILDEQYRAVGLLTGAIVLMGIILRLFIGNLLDKINKTKLIKIGIALNSTAWLFKVGIVSALQIFLVSTYHVLALIVLRTSLDTLVYEKAADRGHYIDEYTVIKEMSLQLGRIISLILIAILLLFFPLQISFIIASIAVLFISLLK